MGIKFGFRYHTINISVPINITVTALAGDRAHMISFGLVLLGYLGLKFMEEQIEGDVYELEVVQKQCNEYNLRYAFKQKELRKDYFDLIKPRIRNNELVFYCCVLFDQSKKSEVEAKVFKRFKEEKANLTDDEGKFLMENCEEAYERFEGFRKKVVKDEELVIDVTEKMNIMVENGKFEQDFHYVVVTSLDPSLCDKKQPVLNVVYAINGKLVFSQFDRKQVIKIGEGAEVVGVLNKVRNFIGF